MLTITAMRYSYSFTVKVFGVGKIKVSGAYGALKSATSQMRQRQRPATRTHGPGKVGQRPGQIFSRTCPHAFPHTRPHSRPHTLPRKSWDAAAQQSIDANRTRLSGQVALGADGTESVGTKKVWEILPRSSAKWTRKGRRRQHLKWRRVNQLLRSDAERVQFSLWQWQRQVREDRTTSAHSQEKSARSSHKKKEKKNCCKWGERRNAADERWWFQKRKKKLRTRMWATLGS